MIEPRVATILNVNDDDASRYMVTRILEMSGHRVIEASTGGDALRLAAELRPELVVLDVRLPDISGYEVCRAPALAPRDGLHLGDAHLGHLRHLGQAGAGPGQRRGCLPHRALRARRAARHGEEPAAPAPRRARMRQRADQLAEADRRKDEFLAMLAHELRNPLAAIMTAIGILERKPSGRPEGSAHALHHQPADAPPGPAGG